MKKLFSSALTFITAFTFLTTGSPLTTFAEGVSNEPVPVETLEEVCLGDIDDLSIGYQSSKEALSNFGDNGYCFYDFLDENGKYVYQQLVPLINNPTNKEYTLELNETVTVSLSELPTSKDIPEEDLDKYEVALFGSCKPAIDSVMFDFPEFCWIDVTNVAVRPGNDVKVTRNGWTGGYTITFSSVVITPAYYSVFSTADEVNAALDDLWDAVAAFNAEGKTRYEQVKSIHDQICYFTYYDLDAKLRGSALGALVTPGVVCEGYAKAFKLICDKYAIPCVVIYGNETEEDESAHMWNYVQMEDGNWYGMDVTWDDLDGDYGREIKYDYFLKGSRSFNRVHTEQPDYSITYLNYPTIAKSDYNPNTANIVSTTTTTTTTTTTSTTTTTAKPTTTTTKATTTTAKPTTTTTKATTTTAKSTTTTTKATTTTAKPTTTTTKATTTTAKPTTTTTKATTTTAKPTTTTTKATTTTAKPTTTTTKATTTTAKPTTTTTKATTTTAKPTTTTTKATTTTAKPTTTTTKATTTTAKPTTTTTKATTTSTTTAPPVLDGDLNKDGVVNVADLLYCAKTVHGTLKPQYSCDANKDKQTDVFDVIYMRKLLLKSMK